MRTGAPPSVRIPAPVDLGFDEICLITAYRQMRDRQKGEMLSIMQDVARTFAENPNPVFRVGSVA